MINLYVYFTPTSVICTFVLPTEESKEANWKFSRFNHPEVMIYRARKNKSAKYSYEREAQAIMTALQSEGIPVSMLRFPPGTKRRKPKVKSKHVQLELL